MNNGAHVVLQMLDAVTWFSRVGLADKGNIIILKSWEQAIKSYETVEWEAIEHEALNILSRSVYDKDYERYQNYWSEIVSEVKSILDPMIAHKTSELIEKESLPKSFISTIQWHLLLIVYSAEYADFENSPLVPKLAYWYMKGHFPCGWEGDYPEGKLVVY